MEAEYNGDGKGEVFGHDRGKEIDRWVGMHEEWYNLMMFDVAFTQSTACLHGKLSNSANQF